MRKYMYIVLSVQLKPKNISAWKTRLCLFVTLLSLESLNCFNFLAEALALAYINGKALLAAISRAGRLFHLVLSQTQVGMTLCKSVNLPKRHLDPISFSVSKIKSGITCKVVFCLPWFPQQFFSQSCRFYLWNIFLSWWSWKT